jgi:hypothetical protein
MRQGMALARDFRDFTVNQRIGPLFAPCYKATWLYRRKLARL